MLADLFIDQSVSLLVLLQHDFPKLDTISSFWVWCNISKKHIFHFLSFISLKTTELFSKELSAQTTMQYTSGSHRGIVNYNVAVDQKMSLSLCSSPEGPWRSMYQRLERSLKCCWQNRQRALHLCQSFSFEWFKLSRAQQELILAQGGSSTQRKRFTAICMLLYSSLIPGLSSCSWGSAGWNPGSAHTFHLVTTARCSALMTYRSPASWCTCEPSRC